MKKMKKMKKAETLPVGIRLTKSLYYFVLFAIRQCLYAQHDGKSFDVVQSENFPEIKELTETLKGILSYARVTHSLTSTYAYFRLIISLFRPPIVDLSMSHVVSLSYV